MHPKKRELPLTEPIGGTHHCMATAQSVLEQAFRYLHASCMSHGGNLSEPDLVAAQEELTESYLSALDIFEGIHQRCMAASGIASPKVLELGKMLSALLLACGQRTASYCFSLQVNRMGTLWIEMFFDALSDFIQRKIKPDAEREVNRAYAESVRNLRQKLTIKTLLLENNVKGVLLDCISSFESPAMSIGLVSEMDDEINRFIGKSNSTVMPHVSRITVNQMQKFASLFPREARMVLKATIADKSKIA